MVWSENKNRRRENNRVQKEGGGFWWGISLSLNNLFMLYPLK